MSPFERMSGFVPHAPAALPDKHAANPIAATQSRITDPTRATTDRLREYFANLRSGYDDVRLSAAFKPGDVVFVHPSAPHTAA